MKLARILAVGAMLALSTSVAAPAADADDGPPAVIPGYLPADGPPAPFDATQQRNQCAMTRADTDTVPPPAQRYLNFQSVWKFTEGQGQTVAVIDTGVAPNPLFEDRLIAGGDYVSNKSGLEDCDAHGTLVAGIIGARNTGGFSGVTPKARIITIRTESAAYEPQGTIHKDTGDPSQGYGRLPALAAAIVHAVNMGATVINLSETSCPDGSAVPDDAGIGAAVQFASNRNVVVVAAAGNQQQGECPNGNPNLIDPQHPGTSPWEHITTYVSPARFSQYVLSVGSVDATGRPSVFTVPGPWVGVAAPGEQIVSTDPNGPGLTKYKVDQKGDTGTFQGTSFAAPYVAGIAALVRAAHPELSAWQVIERIKQTAHASGGGWNPYVGYGIVDPIAAVTADLPPAKAQAIASGNSPGLDQQLPVPPPPPPVDNTARNAALVAAATIALLLTLGVLAAAPIRRVLDKD